MGCQYFEPADGGANSITVAMPRLTFGRGTLSELGARTARLGLKSVVLFTDPYLADGPLVAIAKESLKAAGIETLVYSDIRVEPCDDTVQAAAMYLKNAPVQGVVSVGGGSVIDTAKGALLVAELGGHIFCATDWTRQSNRQTINATHSLCNYLRHRIRMHINYRNPG